MQHITLKDVKNVLKVPYLKNKITEKWAVFRTTFAYIRRNAMLSYHEHCVIWSIVSSSRVRRIYAVVSCVIGGWLI